MKRYIVGVLTVGLVVGGILGYHAPYWVTILVIVCLFIYSSFFIIII